MTKGRNSAAVEAFVIASVTTCWLVCSIAQLEKYLRAPLGVIVSVIGCACVVAALEGLQHFRARRDWGYGPVLGTCALLVLSFVVMYPRAQHHAAGKGSDREDALRVESVALVHHQFPYDARTFLGHRPTPLPGAVALSFPFFLMGRIALQNLVWLAAFSWMLVWFFRRRITAAVFAVLFLLMAPENLNDFVVGGDYITNIMYIAVAMFLFDRALERKFPAWVSVVAAAFLGVAVSSRIIYLVALIPLFALSLQRVSRLRAIALLGTTLVVAATVTIPVFLPHPIPRLMAQLGQNSDKLQYLPHWLQGNALPLLGAAAVSVAFFIRMNLGRAYLLFGAATLIMVLPPLASMINAYGSIQRLPADLEYLSVCAIFLSLALFQSLENTALQAQRAI